MNVSAINLVLAGVAVAGGLAVVLNVAFWGFQYLAVPANDGVGTQGWVILFFLNGCIVGYGVSAPAVLTAWLVGRKSPVV